MTDPSAILTSINLPDSLLLVVTFIFSGYALLRMAAESYEKVAKVLGPLGRRWSQAKAERLSRATNIIMLTDQLAVCDRKRAAQRHVIDVQNRELEFLRKMRDGDQWNKLLQRQIDRLSETVRVLMDRSEVTDAYIAMDTEWHRRADIIWAAGYDRETIEREVPPYKTFLAFERELLSRRAAAPPPPTV